VKKLNPQMEKDKKRRLSLLENGVASAQQKLDNPELNKDAKKHLQGRLSRFKKEIGELKKELYPTTPEEKESVTEKPKKGKKKAPSKG